MDTNSYFLLNHTHPRIASFSIPNGEAGVSNGGMAQLLVSGFWLVAIRANQKPETRNQKRFSCNRPTAQDTN
jgi:hypothetical protein